MKLQLLHVGVSAPQFLRLQRRPPELVVSAIGHLRIEGLDVGLARGQALLCETPLQSSVLCLHTHTLWASPWHDSGTTNSHSGPNRRLILTNLRSNPLGWAHRGTVVCACWWLPRRKSPGARTGVRTANLQAGVRREPNASPLRHPAPAHTHTHRHNTTCHVVMSTPPGSLPAPQDEKPEEAVWAASEGAKEPAAASKILVGREAPQLKYLTRPS